MNLRTFYIFYYIYSSQLIGLNLSKKNQYYFSIRQNILRSGSHIEFLSHECIGVFCRSFSGIFSDAFPSFPMRKLHNFIDTLYVIFQIFMRVTMHICKFYRESELKIKKKRISYIVNTGFVETLNFCYNCD